MKVKIAIIGEAWGLEEERTRIPFSGKMSWQLTPMLREAGIDLADGIVLNESNIRYDVKIALFCGPKVKAIEGYRPLANGQHCHSKYAPQLDRLAAELLENDPNVIIAMGNTALWAMSGHT